MRIFRAFADAHLRLRRISQEKVRQWIPGVLTAERVNSARIVRIGRVEGEMKKVAAELQRVRATMNRDVVVELKIAIDPRGEPGGVADRGERVAQRDLRIAEVAGICGGALQSVLSGKVVAGVGIALAARNAEPAEPEFVE